MLIKAYSEQPDGQPLSKQGFCLNFSQFLLAGCRDISNTAQLRSGGYKFNRAYSRHPISLLVSAQYFFLIFRASLHRPLFSYLSFRFYLHRIEHQVASAPVSVLLNSRCVFFQLLRSMHLLFMMIRCHLFRENIFFALSDRVRSSIICSTPSLQPNEIMQVAPEGLRVLLCTDQSYVSLPRLNDFQISMMLRLRASTPSAQQPEAIKGTVLISTEVIIRAVPVSADLRQ